MSADPPTVAQLIEAVLDRRPIDWTSASTHVADTAKPLVCDLQFVAGIAARAGRSFATAGQPLDAVTATAPRATSALATWGDLQVIDHLGSGAHGDVYLAYDQELDRPVALKLLAAGAERGSAQAMAEARHLARVRHANVVTVHGAAMHEGVVGIWMEYITGRTLAEMIADQPVSFRLVVRIATTLCDALSAVHAADLVHGDVKPQNVMLDEVGRVVLMDFSTGRDVAGTGPAVAGTPRYLAPELLQGQPPSVASDVYALGVLVQDLLASTDVPVVRWRERHRAQRLQDVVDTAVRASPQARWSSMAAFADGLHRAVAPRQRPSVRAAAVAFAIGGLLFRASTSTTSDRAIGGGVHPVDVAPIEIPADVTPGDWVAANGEVPLMWTLEPLVSHNLLTGARTVWVTNMAPGVQVEGAVISADARRIAYCAVRPRERRTAIHVVDQDHRVQVLADQPGVAATMLGPFRGALLPALLAYVDGTRELAVYDTRAGNLRARFRVSRDPAGFGLSPDLRFIAYDASQPGAPTARRDLRLHVLATGDDLPLLTAESDDRLPTWTPDGKALLYVSGSGTQTRLMWLPVDARGRAGLPVVVVEWRGELRPAGFDADGRAYVVASRGPVDVMVRSVARHDVPAAATRVSHGESALWPTWAPGGDGLVWARPFSWQANDLVVVDLATGRRRALQGSLDGLHFPRWSPDGTRIAAWGVDPRTRAVHVVDVRTGTVKEFARRAHPAIGSAWGLEWTPDGSALLLQQDQTTLMALHLSTGETRIIDTSSWRAMRHGVAVSPGGGQVAAVVRDRASMEHVVLFSSGRDARTVWSVPPDAEASLAGWVDSGRSVFITRQSPWPHARSSRELWRLSLSGEPPEFTGVRAHDMYYAALDAAGTRVAYQTGSVQPQVLLVSLPTAEH